MPSTTIPESVFLDTEVFDRASYNLDSKQFSALRKHLASGRLQLISTDITVSEVRSRITTHVREEASAHAKFAKDARVLRSSTSARPALSRLDASAIAAELTTLFDDWLAGNKADVLDAREQDAAPVFERYFAGRAPFGQAKGKKHEFPDGFVVEALKEWSASSGQELFVVSGDKPFRDACQECSTLHVKSKLEELLDHVASDDELIAAFIRTQLTSKAQEIAKGAERQFEDLGFHVIDEWGDVEVDVTKMTLTEEPDIIELEAKEATAQLRFDVEFEAHLSWDDSSTGVYDQEEGAMLFMEHRQATVSKRHELVVDVRVTFDGLNPDDFEVDETSLVEPSSGFGITIPNIYR